MLIEVLRLFESLGAKVQSKRRAPSEGGVDAVVDVVLDGSAARFAVEAKSRAPYPGEVRSMAVLHDRLEGLGAPLLVVPYVSESLGKALSAAQWSWADTQGNADICAPGVRIHRRVSSSPPKMGGRALPSGSGSWAIIRSAISDGFVENVTATGRRAGVSQPRVSQVLSRLTAAGYLEREGRSRWTVDRPRLLDAFLEQYAGPGGSTSWFYSLDPPTRVAEEAVGSAATGRGRIAVSGDVAADRIAPWRTPTQVTLYATEPFAATRIEFVAAHGRDDANVEVIVPADSSVFQRRRSGDLPLVHPTQVIWDLTRHGGADREEAAERVRVWFLSR